MDVKYIPSDWEKMKEGIGDLIGLRRWGKGMIDDLKAITENLEDAESDIASLDSDGVISFHHTSQKDKFQQLYEDFEVLHRFTGKVGDIVDRTIDQPFYEDIDAFVEAMRDLSISNYTTKNRVGATEVKVVYGGYGQQNTLEVPKTEVSIDDLFNGDNFYAEQIKLEYDAWKELNPDQDFSQKEYQLAAVNTRAFEYESIRNHQESKEFWGQIAALVVIVGVSLVCPPAGIALGAAYGTFELSSAVSGKDWISGRELGTGERVFRGVLSPLDIIPGVNSITKFSGTVKLAHLGDMGISSIKTGIKSSVNNGVTKVRSLVETAEKMSTPRLKRATSAIKDVSNKLKNKLIDDTIEVGRFIDSATTFTKNIFSTRKPLDLAMEGFGNTGSVRMPVENTHAAENYFAAKLGKSSSESTRLIPGTPGKVTGGSSSKLGKNMFEEMGLPRTTKRSPYQAQHIIPAEFNEYPILQKIGMDMDHASNGFFLRVPDEYVSSTSRHQGYHSVYSDFVERKLDEIDINQDISIIEKQVFELQQKLRKLQEKGLPLYMTNDYLQKELNILKQKGLDDYLLDRANNKNRIRPVWGRGGGATIDLWERWFNKL
ncbi:AHH domain-containing protein [Heyndrickxia sporothermodurans]|uniref:AHH domain-containing protein n=1 Tax=Heyndrickxia sporothermodurans TaxID=46224 RepID=UPI001F34AB1D|nr:AHH domain-containing protein [Heyndrickxia sporothermodurans]